MKRQYRNPWSQQLVEREATYFAANENEMQGAYNDAAYGDSLAVIPCGLCGADAYMKLTVGAYKCPSCGALRCFGKPVKRADGYTEEGEEIWVPAS